MIDVNSDSSRRLVMQLAIYKELIKEKNVVTFFSLVKVDLGCSM